MEDRRWSRQTGEAVHGQKSLTHTAAGGALSSRCTALDPHSHGVHSEASPTSRAGRNFPTPFPCQESRELQGNPGLCSPSMDPQLLGQGLQVCPLVCNCLQLQCLLMRDVPVCPELQALSGLSCLHAHWNRCDPCPLLQCVSEAIQGSYGSFSTGSAGTI